MSGTLFKLRGFLSSCAPLRQAHENHAALGIQIFHLLPGCAIQKEFVMNIKINQDILEGKWKQAKGKVKQQWGKLTDNQLDQISGRTEELVGLLQESYGYSVERAQQEVDDFVRRFAKEKSSY